MRSKPNRIVFILVRLYSAHSRCLGNASPPRLSALTRAPVRRGWGMRNGVSPFPQLSTSDLHHPCGANCDLASHPGLCLKAAHSPQRVLLSTSEHTKLVYHAGNAKRNVILEEEKDRRV